MVCGLTVRKLKPGTFDDFREAFMANDPAKSGDMPPGAQFFMLRNSKDPDEVICFGLMDGTPDEVRSSELYDDYEEQVSQIDQYVESVGADGMYEMVEHVTA